jgi:hypothetical protein
MKLKTAIAVLIVGLCPAAAWAGAEKDSAQQPQASAQQDSTAPGASGASAQDSGKTTGWQYVNGRTTNAEREMQGAQSASNADSPRAADAASAADDDSSDSDRSSDTQNPSMESAQDPAQEQAMGDQSIQLQGIPEGLQDKLVVILPTDWQGSLRDLLAALEQTSQDSEILVLRRETQADDMSSQNSEDIEDTSDTDSR